MFESLPERFRAHGLPADIKTVLLLRKSIDKKLINTLGDVYLVLKGIIVKDPKMMGPYTKAYYDYFINISIGKGESLEDAILRSETFKEWKKDYEFDPEKEESINQQELLDTFIAQVHLTSYDIKNIINGKDILDKDNPELKDRDFDMEDDLRQKMLDRMADYSDIDLEELLERMRKIAEQQRGKHSGGSHWIGSGGISPYGFGGAAMGGIRFGGSGGGKMARKVINSHNFYPVDRDSIINDNNVDAALASLKGIFEETAQQKLDVNETIDQGLKQGGLFLPMMKDVTDYKLQVILLVDNGGYSMDPYIRRVQDLFKKMKTRFAHDLETYYFHNTIYDKVYSDPSRRKAVSIDKILSHDPAYRVFIIGDAAMAPYELHELSIINWGRIKEKFPKCAWLNPEPVKYWAHTYTTMVLKQIFNMYPLTPKGIEESVVAMNKKK